MGDGERVYYDPALVSGARLWFWATAIAALDWANGQTYGRARGFLWARWHAAYLARR
jgi:hypothetical protein